jgi:Leucine-rich repeat (LRR) protein
MSVRGAAAAISDAQLLLQFKAGIVELGASQVLADSWIAENVDSAGCPQGWYGVTFSNPGCNAIALSLPGLSLSGEIRQYTLGNLSHLNSLSLALNSLNGSLPADLGALSQLQSLDLSNNHLAGTIPQSFGNLQSLVNLSLANNVLLSGSIVSVLELPELVSLNLSGNALTEGLAFSDNLVEQAKLATLDLSNNQLSGSIDPLLTLLPSLAFLNLSGNAFSGIIPPGFGQCCTTLMALDLSNNGLTGPIPTMDLMESLVSLRLAGNGLSSSVPSQLLNDLAPLLQELDLSSNKLTGSLEQVTSSTLQVLNLSSNELEGALPSRLKSCMVVDLSSNLFSGGISLASWSPGLEILDLSHNQLNGTLDDEALMQPFRLQAVDLSFNQLTGSIPLKLLLSPSISQLSLSNNQFSGAILVQPLGTTAVAAAAPSPPLRWLDLSTNNLSGQIPDAIASYINLEALLLDVNQLSGSIPTQLSNLSLLRELDVSSNLLTGAIPADLPASLHLLNVSHNNLSGTLPPNLMKLFPNASFFPGNPNLMLPLTTTSSSDPGIQVTLGNSKKNSSSVIRVGLIGGCTVGAALLIAAALLVVYFRNSSNYTTIKTSVKVPPPLLPQDAKAVPRDLLPMDSVHPETIPAIGFDSSKPQYHNDLEALDLQKSAGDSPIWARLRSAGGLLSSAADDSSSLSSEQHQMVLKVHSPDRLAGDLFFLDGSLLFTAEELSRAPAEVLGRSSHGTSYKATLDNGHVLTVKWLREGLAKNKKDFTREAKRFGGIKHPHVVPMRGYYWGPREHEKLLLSDYVSTGSLACHLYEKSGGVRTHPALTWEQRLQIAIGVANGLTYLHGKQGLAHGNLKASNVLLQGPHLQARVADYSLHRLMTAAGTANHILNAGALGYRSPELAATRKPKPSLAGDVYALGVILMELLTGKGAGDIMSGNSGAVDLPDWVRLMASEGRPVDCFDRALVGLHRDQEPLKGMHEVLKIALLCMSPHSMRPNMRVVYDQLVALTSSSSSFS